MKNALERLVHDLADTPLPLRSEAATADAHVVIADAVLCALLAGRAEATGLSDPGGVRYWAGPVKGRGPAVELNALQAHQLELDSVHFVTRGHPAAVIAPALSALIDVGVLQREDAVDAFALATEVMAYLGQAWGPGLAAQATHATAFIGPAAAVAAVGRVLRWSADDVESGLFAALALGAGRMSTFGTSLKPLQVGRAAGLIVDLVTRPPADTLPARWIQEMEGRFGPVQGDWISAEEPRFGTQLVVEQVPSMVKMMPACAFFASPLDHTLAVLSVGVDGQLLELLLDVPAEAAGVNRGGVPERPEEVAFSLEYLLACLWVARSPGDFRAHRWMSDPEVAALVPRIRLRAIPGQFDFIDTRLHGELRIRTSTSHCVRPVTYRAQPRRYGVADLARKWDGIGVDQGWPPSDALDALLTDLRDPSSADSGGWFPRFYQMPLSRYRKEQHAQDSPR